MFPDLTDSKEVPNQQNVYFPGFGLPDFSPKNQFKSAGAPGHISIVSSPFLANSKNPVAPHLIKADEYDTPKKQGNAKKHVVINIINGVTSNQSLNFLNPNRNGEYLGLQGIIAPMNDFKSAINSLKPLQRKKRSDSKSQILENNDLDKKVPSNARKLTGKSKGTGRRGPIEDDYLYYSPPETANTILNLNSFNYQSDYEYYDYLSEYAEPPPPPEPVDPSQLLIGFGGIRSTTRIPFIKKPDYNLNMQQFGTDQNNNIVYDNDSGKQEIIQDEEIFFGDFSNLIALNKQTLNTKGMENTNTKNQNPRITSAQYLDSRPVQPSGSLVQKIFRPNTRGQYLAPNINANRQKNNGNVQQLPQRLRPPVIRRPRPIPSRIKPDDYTEYDYDDYFNFNENQIPDRKQKVENKPVPNAPYPNYLSQPPYNPYPSYPPQYQYPYYPQYPPYPLAPAPASSSASTSCSSGGCAAAASAAAGGSSSSSTSSSGGGNGAG